MRVKISHKEFHARLGPETLRKPVGSVHENRRIPCDVLRLRLLRRHFSSIFGTKVLSGRFLHASWAFLSNTELKSLGEPIVSLRCTVQRDPGTKRVHVIPPMNGFPAFNSDDRNESVMIVPLTCKDRPVNLVFKDDGPTILCAMDHQRVA